MHPYYTSTPSSFYGASGGRSHTRTGARRDLGAQPDPEPLVGDPAKTMLRIYDVAESSQLATKEGSALAQATHMEMHGTMMDVQEERRRAPTALAEIELQWVADDVLNILDHNTLLQYAIMACDAYFGLHHRWRPRPMGQVYLYCLHLIVMIVMYPQMNHFFN